MEKLLQIAEKEWAVVSGAPITIALIALGIWATIRFIYKDRLESARELLELKSKQLEEIQARTGAETPEDVSKRLDRIEAELKELGETDLAAVFTKGLRIGDFPNAP